MLQCKQDNPKIIMPMELVPFIIQASLELETRKTFVDIDVYENDNPNAQDEINIDIDVSSNHLVEKDIYTDGVKVDHRHCLRLLSYIAVKNEVFLGSTLHNITVELPKRKILIGDNALLLRLTPPIDIEANELQIRAAKLEIQNTEKYSIASVQAANIDVYLTDYKGITNLGLLQIVYPGKLGYPLNQCQNESIIPNGDINREHALRLRKILMLFRSHSKGTMARYCGKIDHRRVMKGEWEKRLLDKLLKDSILYKIGNFYHINPEQVDSFLGINWEQLRTGDFSAKFISYVNMI